MNCLNCNKKHAIEITCSQCNKKICIACRFPRDNGNLSSNSNLKTSHLCISKEIEHEKYKTLLAKNMPQIIGEKIIKF